MCSNFSLNTIGGSSDTMNDRVSTAAAVVSCLDNKQPQKRNDGNSCSGSVYTEEIFLLSIRYYYSTAQN